MTTPRHTTPSHLPPQSLEAEEAILGAMMMSSVAIETANDLRLSPEHFYRPSHVTIFNAIMTLADRDSVDELTVINYLKANSSLADVGGPAAVMTLAERVPAVANAKAYAEEVIDAAELRWLVETGHAIAKLGYEHPRPPRQLWDEAAEMLMTRQGSADTGGLVAADSLLDGLYEQWEERAANGGKLIGHETGFTDLDRRIGGLQPGRFYVVAGRPGMGKTSFILNVAEHLTVGLGEHVLFYSYEMDAEDLTIKLVSSVAKVDGSRLMNSAPQDQDWQAISDAMTHIKNRAPGRLRIDTRLLNAAGLRTSIRREVAKIRKAGGKVGAVIVDYIQLLEGNGNDKDRQNEISKISRTMKRTAMEVSVPLVGLSQLNRSVESRPDRKPMLSDLRESGSLEQDADGVLLIYRPEYYFPEDPELAGIAQVIVAKNRRGRTGTEVLGFHGPYTRFVNLEKGAA